MIVGWSPEWTLAIIAPKRVVASGALRRRITHEGL